MSLDDYLKQRRESAQQQGARPQTTDQARVNGTMVLLREVRDRLTQDSDLKTLPPEQARSLARQRGWRIIEELSEGAFRHLILGAQDKSDLLERLLQSMFGFGVLEPLLRDPTITEIMINGPQRIFIERTEGTRSQSVVATDRHGQPLQFVSLEELNLVIEKIVAPLNRKVDESDPVVDARLPDGSRVNVVLHPISLDGTAITIRRFPRHWTIDELVAVGSLSQELADLLKLMVEARYNIIVSGGTGSGKTTFLNALSQFIRPMERIITVEDSAELQLRTAENIIRMETRPANIEGKGAIAIRDLVKSALRMRPDRIIVGECRGGEAIDMLQAMNTGHDGSLTTGHANTATDMLRRLETMVLMSGLDLPLYAIRQQISSAVDIIVQLSRLSDRSRRVVQVTEVLGLENGDIVTQDLLLREGLGELRPTGARLTRRHKFIAAGIQPRSPLLEF